MSLHLSLFQLPLIPPIPHIILLREKKSVLSTESSFLLDLICLGLNVSHKNTLHSELAYQTVSSMDSSTDCTLSTVGPPEVWKPKAAFGFSRHDFRISVPMLCFEKLSCWWFCTIKKILLSVRRTNQPTNTRRQNSLSCSS